MSKQVIDEAMQSMPKNWRFRWCENNVCGCMGAANCTGGLMRKGFNKEDWHSWVMDNGGFESLLTQTTEDK